MAPRPPYIYAKAPPGVNQDPIVLTDPSGVPISVIIGPGTARSLAVTVEGGTIDGIAALPGNITDVDARLQQMNLLLVNILDVLVAIGQQLNANVVPPAETDGQPLPF